MAYLGKTPSQAVRSRYYFTASGGETSLSGTDDNSNTLTFTDGNYVDVSLNGVALVAGTDYNTTTANTIGGLTALTASDVVEVVVYDTFSVFGGKVLGDFDISNGTLSAEAVTVTGLTTTGDINFGDNDKAVFGAGSDLQIYHDGSDSYINDTGTGQLRLAGSTRVDIISSGGEFMGKFTADGAAELYHNNAAKLATTSTGIDVTGAITTDAITETSGGNVGIGTSSPSTILQLKRDSAGTGQGDYPLLDLDNGNASGYAQLRFADDGTEVASILSHMTDKYIVFRAGGSTERMRIDSSGNVLVSKTAIGTQTVGIEARSDGLLAATRDGNRPLLLNRLTSDGEILLLQKDGVHVGSIGARSGNVYIVGADAGIKFGNNSAFVPTDASGNNQDNTRDVGSSSVRFDDIFATNGTIQTSDQNEKEQIASLTTAEMTAAKAISKLFKTFKWQDKVAAKGDAARRHAGVIAQEVQTAMTDAGLNAADYAFWCSDTWWEADETYTDDDGVEQTRTNTYDTEEDAPEGATQRTRLGIRYAELLAFIGAATEQRLADIETRLTALENAE